MNSDLPALAQRLGLRPASGRNAALGAVHARILTDRGGERLDADWAKGLAERAAALAARSERNVAIGLVAAIILAFAVFGYALPVEVPGVSGAILKDGALVAGARALVLLVRVFLVAYRLRLRPPSSRPRRGRWRA